MKKWFSVSAIIIMFILFSWGQCIYKFAKCDFNAPAKAELIYGIGCACPPFGVVVGWMDLGR